MRRRRREIETEIAALADGSLDPARQEQVRQAIEASPKHVAELERQRRALALLDTAGQAKAPDSLHRAVASLTSAQPAKVRTRPANVRTLPYKAGGPARLRLLATASVAAVAVAVALAVGLSIGGASSSVQQAVALTLAPSTQPSPPESRTHSSELTASVGGVAFPYWGERFGWHSVGARTDRIDGRATITVFYQDGRGHRIGYAIVSGPAWPVREGVSRWRGGVRYRLLHHGVATSVAWSRGGHLCVVSGRRVSAATLLLLASWNDGGAARAAA
jgi:anti-sigma factor RsiW